MDRNQEINIEKDFWDDFVVEAFENIDEIEQNAMLLEQNPENTDILHAMFRCFHTVKGLAGFVEHVIVQEIAHKTETMMDYCRKGILHANTDIVNMILTSADCIKTLCNDMNAYKDSAFMDKVEVLIENLETTSAKAENSGDEANSQEQSISQQQAEVQESPQEQQTEYSQNNFDNNQMQENSNVVFENSESGQVNENDESNVDADLAQFSSEITKVEHEVEEKERQHEQMVHDVQEQQMSHLDDSSNEIAVETSASAVPQSPAVQQISVEQAPQVVKVEVEQVPPQNVVQPVVQGVVEVPVAPVPESVQQQINQANQEIAENNLNEEDYSRSDDSNSEPQKELNPFHKEVLKKFLPNVMVSSEDSSVTNRTVGNDE